MRVVCDTAKRQGVGYLLLIDITLPSAEVTVVVCLPSGEVTVVLFVPSGFVMAVVLSFFPHPTSEIAPINRMVNNTFFNSITPFFLTKIL